MALLTTTDNNKFNKSYNFLAWMVCLIGALFYCYEYILRIFPNVMTQDLMREFHLSASQYSGWAVYYYYSYTALQLVIGLLMDRYGPRRLLFLSCLACTIGAFVFAHSHTLFLIKASRFLIGFGSAFAFVGVLKLASIWLASRYFAFIAGLVTSLGMIGGLIGNLFLERLITDYGWRYTSILSGWVGVMLTIMILLLVHDRAKNERAVYLSEINFRSVFKGTLDALKNPHIWLSGIIGMILYLALSAFAELWGVSYLSISHGLTSNEAVSANGMVFLGWAIGAPLTAWFADLIKRRRLFLQVGCILSLLLFCVIVYVPYLPKSLLFLLLFLFGIATSVEVIVFAISRDLSAKYLAATAVALTNAIVMFGGIIFQNLIGILLDVSWRGKTLNGVNVYTISDYQFALSVIPIAFVIGVILSFIIKEKQNNCEL